MRLFTDEEISNMSNITIDYEIQRIHEKVAKNSSDENRNLLKQKQRQRHLMFWHDGSCISNHSHLLMTVNVLYDPAIYYTNEEYYRLSGEKQNLF